MAKRLVLVSSRARNKLAVYASVLPNVIAMEYSYETFGLDDILDQVAMKLKVTKVAKVASIAFILHTSEKVSFWSKPQIFYPALKFYKEIVNRDEEAKFLHCSCSLCYEGSFH